MLLTVLLAGCARGEPADDDRVMYRLDGALTGMREIEAEPGAMSENLDTPDGAWGAARVGCSMVNISDGDPKRGAAFVLSAVQNFGEEHGAGVYVKVQGFHGVGRYALDVNGGRAWVFDRAHIQACVRAGDRTCFQGVEGCTVDVTRWDFSPGAAEKPAGYPESVSVGVAEGTFSCRRLVNTTTNDAVRIVSGSFHCRAADWTK